MVCTPLVTESNTVGGYVCGPSRLYRRYVDTCEACKRPRRMVRRWDGMYYGYTEACCHCGSIWQDGCKLGNITDREAALRWWSEALPARDFDRRIRKIERSYFDEVDAA